MKATTTDQLSLLKLQEHDNHIAHLSKLRANIPLQAELDAVLLQIQEFSQVELARHQELEEAKRDLSRVEDDVKVVDERIAKDRAREELNLAAKDLQALEAELDSLALRKNELEDTELNVMQAVEDAEEAVAALSNEHQQLAANRLQLEQQLAEEQTRLDNELATEKTERARLAASLPTELVDLYENQRSRYGIGAAALVHKVSGGSGMSLTATDVERIRAIEADEVVLCPDSSCILIRTNESW